MSERDDHPHAVTRTVAIGEVRGSVEDGVCRFLGIPYAEPPVGENCFREAKARSPFGALAALKLIDVANGRRAKVGALDGSVIAASLDHALSTSQIKVADVWDVRRTIEMRTAALAARNATPAQAARITALAETMGKDDRPHDQTTNDDIDFHLAIAEASGNALFSQIVGSFVPLMRVAVPQAWKTRRTDEQRSDILERHRRLARAIANRDPEEAERSMAAHFDDAIGALLR